MLPNFENFVIETYTQLAAVLALLTALIVFGGWLWRRLRARTRAPELSRLQPARARAKSAVSSAEARLRAAHAREFDRLATMISSASDRAEQITVTQSAAALKLDTAEVAVNRLLADIDGIMTVARPPAAAATAPPAAAVLPGIAPKRPSIAA